MAHHFYWELKSIQEGVVRFAVDKPLRDKQLKEAEDIQPNQKNTDDFHNEYSRLVEKGYAPESERESNLHEWVEELKCHLQLAARESAHLFAKKEVKVPGEPDVIDELLAATEPKQVVELCKDAFSFWPKEVEPNVTREIRRPNWPISGGSVLPMYLTQFAAQVIAAKTDPRFPKSSSRPSSRMKQLWFLSRALAGAVCGVATRTAINLVGSIRPDQGEAFSRATKPRRSSTATASRN